MANVIQLKHRKPVKTRRLKTFFFTTDGGSEAVKAETVNGAVSKFMGFGSKVKTVKQFKSYLEKVGGYGVIEAEDGTLVLRVRG